jgi:hypothetical protein
MASDNQQNYVLNIEILESNRKTKRYNEGLETYLYQEIREVLPQIDISKIRLWSEIKNIVAIKLMDKRDYYKDLEDVYKNINWKYKLSLSINVAIGLYFIGKYCLK